MTKRTILTGKVDSLGRPIKVSENNIINEDKKGKLPHHFDNDKIKNIISNYTKDYSNNKFTQGLKYRAIQNDETGKNYTISYNGELVHNTNPITIIPNRIVQKSLQQLSDENSDFRNYLEKNGVEKTLKTLYSSGLKKVISSRETKAITNLKDNWEDKVYGFSRIAGEEILSYNTFERDDRYPIDSVKFDNNKFGDKVTITAARTPGSYDKLSHADRVAELEKRAKIANGTEEKPIPEGFAVYINSSTGKPGTALFMPNDNQTENLHQEDFIQAAEQRANSFITDYGQNYNDYIVQYPNDSNAYSRWATEKNFYDNWSAIKSM